MGNIRLRPLTKNDYTAYKQLINNAWHTADYIKNPAILNAALDIYMRLCLLSVTYSYVAEKDGKVLGIIAAKAKQQRRIAGFCGTFFHLGAVMRDIILLPFCSRSDRRNLLEYAGESTYHMHLLRGKKNRYDCSIDFFVMSSESRGLGIGKQLLRKTFEYFTECGAKRVYLFTDTWCNYGFYDSQGFSLADSKEYPQEEGSAERHKVFLYEKDIEI